MLLGDNRRGRGREGIGRFGDLERTNAKRSGFEDECGVTDQSRRSYEMPAVPVVCSFFDNCDKLQPVIPVVHTTRSSKLLP